VVDRPPESKLIERARAGDGDAYAELVRAHQQVAYRTAWLICGSATEAEDVVQDAFIKAWAALGRFRRAAPFRPWLLAIVANEARSRGRRSGRQARLLEELLANDRLSGGAVPPPDATAVAHSETAALRASLAGLSARDREIVGLRYFLELSEAEIAQLLGVRRGTVKSRLSRALDRLRAEAAVEAR
jgi:RNA polymerase sigma factor (sigma-70 family)